MAQLKKNFVSMVLLGGPNPQILNVEFLKKNKIIPLDEPPFDRILQQEPPFTRFVSTPPFTNLVLGTIEFTVEINRFQVRDNSVVKWTDTRILDIVKQYFKVLRHTPINVVGINLNSTLSFDTPEEAANLQKLFLAEDSPIIGLVSGEGIVAGTAMSWPYSKGGGRIKFEIAQPDKAKGARTMNFNYEFGFIGWTEFEAELGNFSEITAYCDDILGQLLKAI